MLDWSAGDEVEVALHAYTHPEAPTGLRATAIGVNPRTGEDIAGLRAIDLAWEAPGVTGSAASAAIAGYRIETSDDGAASWSDLVANTGSPATSWRDSYPVPNQTRHYRVSAIDADGDIGPASGTASAITAAGIVSVEVISTPAQGGQTYLPGETIEIEMTMNEGIDLQTTLFNFELGAATVTADCTPPGNSSACIASPSVVFRYVVRDGDLDADGIGWAANSLVRPDFTTTVGYHASSAHPAAGPFPAHRVEGRALTVSVADAPETAEGDAAAFEVTLSHELGHDVEVTWSTAAGTATAGQDYAAAALATLTIAAGSTTASLEVATAADALDEAPETFTVTLDAATGGASVDAEASSATATIIDDVGDVPPALEVDGVSVAEGDDAVLTVALSAPSGREVTVAWSTSDGTATAGEDYTAVSAGTLAFAPGETATTIAVPTLADIYDEAAEAFAVMLARQPYAGETAPVAVEAQVTIAANAGTHRPEGGLTGPGAATVELWSATLTVGTLGTSFSGYFDGEQSDIGMLTDPDFRRDGEDYAIAQINYRVSELQFALNKALVAADVPNLVVQVDARYFPLGKATYDLVDPHHVYRFAARMLGWDRGDTVALRLHAYTHPAAPTGLRAVVEGPSAVALAWEAPAVTGSPASAAIAGYRIEASDDGGATWSDLSANTGSSATSWRDATIGPDRTRQYRISAIDAEGDRGPATAGVAARTPHGVASIEVTSAPPRGGGIYFAGETIEFTVTMTRDTDLFDAALEFRIGEQTATASCVETDGRCRVSPLAVFRHVVQADAHDEDGIGWAADPLSGRSYAVGDTRSVSLSYSAAGPLPAHLVDGRALTVSVEALVESPVEGTPRHAAGLSLTLSRAVGHAVEVTWSTSDGTAVAGADYTAVVAATHIFEPRAIFALLEVPIVSDALDEEDETFTVTLDSATGGAVVHAGKGAATITIADDDPTPGLSLAGVSVAEGGEAVLEAVLSAPSGRDVVIDWSTVDGTAVAGSDYTAVADATLTLAAGRESATLRVVTLDDAFHEDAETFTVHATRRAYGGETPPGPVLATVTIPADDDANLAGGGHVAPTVPTTRVWNAELTVGSTSGGFVLGYYGAAGYGALEPGEFPYGSDYEVRRVEFISVSNTLFFGLDKPLPSTARRNLVLQLGERYYYLDRAGVMPSPDVYGYVFTVVPLGWSADDTVAVRLHALSVPDAPGSLAAFAHGSRAVDLSWTAPEVIGSGVAGYVVEASDDRGANWRVLAGLIGSGVTVWRDDTPAPATTRSYRVRAYNAMGVHGAPSETARATTAHGVASIEVTSTPPRLDDTYLSGETIEVTVTMSTPSELVGAALELALGEATVAATCARATERCMASPSAVFRYTVQKREADTDGIAWAANPLRGTAFVAGRVEEVDLVHPAAGPLRRHKVNGNDLVPVQVTGVQVRPSLRHLEVSWDRPAPAPPGFAEPTGYKVQWKSGSEDFDAAHERLVEGADSTTVSVRLAAGVAHAVRVIATNEDADGPPSVEIWGTPLGPQQPPPLGEVFWEADLTVTRYEFGGRPAWGFIANRHASTAGVLEPDRFRLPGGSIGFRPSALVYHGNELVLGVNRLTRSTGLVLDLDEHRHRLGPWMEVRTTPSTEYSPRRLPGPLQDFCYCNGYFVDDHGVDWAEGERVRVRLSRLRMPEAPQLAATSGETEVTLRWSAPASDLPVAGYRYRVSADGGTSWAPEWTDVPDGNGNGDRGDERSFTVTGLVNGTEYLFEVLARSDVGEGAPARVQATPTLRADATLARLEVSGPHGALALSPASYDPATYRYTAVVPWTVSRVTIAAPSRHTGATVEWLDAGAQALTDADADAEHFQIDPPVGLTAVDIRVTAPDATVRKTYRLILMRADISRDAALAALGVTGDGGQVALAPAPFDPDVLSYAAQVPNAVRMVTVTPTTRSVLASHVFVDGNDNPHADADSAIDGHQVALAVGASRVKISVTAEDGATMRSYTLRMLRAASSDATLASWTLLDGDGAALAVESTTARGHAARVGAAVETVTVSAEATDPEATLVWLDGDGVPLADADPNLPGRQVSLATGETALAVRITASDGATALTHRLVLVRAADSDDASLARLRLRTGSAAGMLADLVPAFDAQTLDYAAWIAAARITVEAVANDAAARVSWLDGDGAALADADAAAEHFQMDLAAGANVVRIRITAADGETERTYTLTITRPVVDPGQPSAAPVLVANDGQTGSALRFTVNTTRAYAQPFTTGSNPGGYTLDALVLYLREVSADAVPRVRVFTNRGGLPDSVEHTFSNPGSFSTSVDLVANAFEAPSDARLKPRRTYWLVADASAGSMTFGITASDAEDAGHAPGWSIGDTARRRAGAGTAWSASTSPPEAFRMSLRGVPIAADARLRGLAVRHTGGAAALIPSSFDADVLRYAAVVAHEVASVSVAPEVNDAGASIAWLDGNGGTLADADTATEVFDVALAEGANTVRVRVTAADATTVRTYTLVVTRLAAPAVEALVSNIGATVDPVALSVGRRAGENHVRAQMFETGSNDGGYRIDALDVYASNLQAGDGVRLRIFSVNDQGRATVPGSALHTLAAPARDSSVSNTLEKFTFTAPSTATLDAGTKYWIVVDATGSGSPQFNLGATASNAQDGTGAADWRIGNSSRVKRGVGDTWNTQGVQSSKMRIAIRGAALPSMNAGLTGLDVSHGGAALALVPSPFDADTLAYSVSAGYAATQVTLAPVTADPGAVVTYLDAASAVLADADAADGFQVVLAEGENTIRIKVTAEVPSAMRTYVLTVTRRPPSTDATLSGLALEQAGGDTIALDPPFASGTTTYSASVENAVERVTITARTGYADAVISYLDGADGPLADADAADGFQVVLAEGVNTIKVKVTAENGQASETYRLAMTRAISGVPGAPATLAATPRDRSVALVWSAPSDPGASAVTKYRYRVSTDGGAIWSPDWTDVPDSDGGGELADERRLPVTGLTNGVAHVFELAAVNARGAGAPVRATATPGAGPVQVSGVTATSELRHVTVSWSRADASPGYMAATGYRVQWKTGDEEFGAPREMPINGVATTSVALRLPAGLDYKVRVIAVNAAGEGVPSGEVAGTSRMPEPPEPEGEELLAAELRVVHHSSGGAEALGHLYLHSRSSLEPEFFLWNGQRVYIDALLHLGGKLYFYPKRSFGPGRFVLDVDDRRFIIGALTDVSLPADLCSDCTEGYVFDVTGLGWIVGDRVRVRLGRYRVPAAPGASAVAAANGGAALSWTAPASELEVGKYQYRASADGGTSWSPDWTDVPDGEDEGSDLADERSYTVSGLANGTAYTIELRAVSAAGAGAAVQVTVTPVAVPGMPAAFAATPGDRSAVLAWGAPSQTGGSAILNYRYRVSADRGATWSPDWTNVPDGNDAGSDAADETGHAVTGLANGTEHMIELAAVNGAGAGPPARTSVTPVTVPGVPRQLRFVASDSTVHVAWTEPSQTGGSAILNYRYRVSADAGATWSPDWTNVPDSDDAGTALADERSVTLTGLANGTEHTIELVAVNAFGAGAGATGTATPEQVPGPPSDFTASLGDRSAVLAWEAPSEIGGSAIQKYRYRVSADRGVTWSPDWTDVPDGNADGELSDERDYTVTGLANGTEHFVELRAINGAGDGVPTRATVSPAKPPGMPASFAVAPGDRSATLTWAAPLETGGSAVAGYEFRMSTDGGTTWILDWTGIRDGVDEGADRADETTYTLIGLANGTELVFELRAVNAAGGGTPVEARVTPATFPDAPGGFALAPRPGGAVLAWSATGSGGAPILYFEYRVSADDGASWDPDWTAVPDGDDEGAERADETAHALTGLVNGTEHVVELRAVNDLGAGSAVRDRVSPVDLPGAVASLDAVRGDAMVALSWSVPVSDGGLAIGRYQYRVSADDGASWDPDWSDVPDGSDAGIDPANETSLTVTGLVNGTEHSFEVRALNAAGSGAGVQVKATPAAVPGAPEDLRILRGDAMMALSWSAPASDGGLAIGKYQYRVSADDGTSWDPDWSDVPDGSDAGSEQGDETTITVANLANATDYTLELRAVNAVGGGAPARAASGPVTVPGAVATLEAARSDGRAVLSWTAPTNSGGTAVLHFEYRVSANGGTSWDPDWTAVPDGVDADSDPANETDLTVSGLANGTEHTFELRAVNVLGAGSGTSVRSTPAAVPGVPGSFGATRGDRQVTLGWSVPSQTGGTAITGYQYRASADGRRTWLPDWTDVPDGDDAGSDPANETGYTVGGLANGAEYTFELRAVNGVGEGLAARAGATPATVPGAPTGFGTKGGSKSVELTWTAPSQTGGSAIMKYQHRASSDGGTIWSPDWTDIPDGDDPDSEAGNEVGYTMGGLANDTEYAIELRAVNEVGSGAPVRAMVRTLEVPSDGTLVLNVDAIAGDDTVNIAEKAAGFAISGDTGVEADVAVTVQVGGTSLSATSADGDGDGTATWSVPVPADAAYITGTSVAVTVSASKAGFTAPAAVASARSRWTWLRRRRRDTRRRRR